VRRSDWRAALSRGAGESHHHGGLDQVAESHGAGMSHHDDSSWYHSSMAASAVPLVAEAG
jgi:hypothetical protein